jgi:uncharacterized membrane protein YhdT
MMDALRRIPTVALVVIAAVLSATATIVFFHSPSGRPGPFGDPAWFRFGGLAVIAVFVVLKRIYQK